MRDYTTPVRLAPKPLFTSQRPIPLEEPLNDDAPCQTIITARLERIIMSACIASACISETIEISPRILGDRWKTIHTVKVKPGEMLSILRRRRGLTRAALAERMAVPEQRISTAEDGCEHIIPLMKAIERQAILQPTYTLELANEEDA